MCELGMSAEDLAPLPGANCHHVWFLKFLRLGLSSVPREITFELSEIFWWNFPIVGTFISTTHTPFPPIKRGERGASHVGIDHVPQWEVSCLPNRCCKSFSCIVILALNIRNYAMSLLIWGDVYPKYGKELLVVVYYWLGCITYIMCIIPWNTQS